MKRKEADKTITYCAETVQVNNKYDRHKPNFVWMMQKYDFMWDGYLERTAMESYRFVLIPLEEPLMCSAPYLTRPKQQRLEQKEDARMKKPGVAKSALAKWALRIVFVPEKMEVAIVVSTIAD